MRTGIRSSQNVILEGLRPATVSEARRPSWDDDVSFDDMVVVDKRKQLEKEISKKLVAKYGKALSKHGKFEVDVETVLEYDDEAMLDNVVTELHINMYLDDSTSTVKDIIKALQTTVKAFKGFPVNGDSDGDSFYVDVEGNDACGELLDALAKDGCSIKGMYHTERGDDITNAVLAKREEDRQDRRDRDREYFNSRL